MEFLLGLGVVLSVVVLFNWPERSENENPYKMEFEIWVERMNRQNEKYADALIKVLRYADGKESR